MRILFVDPMSRSYDTRTPLDTPIGGTQSAVAYLSAELVRLGEHVTVINGVPETREVDGVVFTPLPVTTDMLNSFDVIVIVASAIGSRLRGIGVTRPMLCMCQHAGDQPAVQAFGDPNERATFTGLGMVSLWQAQDYANRFGIQAAQMRVLRNAISPAFVSEPVQPAWYDRGEGPVLAYTSTPFRGLDALLMAFPLIRERVPAARLRIYSSMAVYGDSAEADKFRALYALARSLPGVEYVGSLPQRDLAGAMATVDYFTYPSTFAETACIAAMEAMAAGAVPVTTPLGALPETTAGYATMVERDAAHIAIFATRYADAVADLILGIDPAAARARRQEQIAFAREQYSWARRALEWQAWCREVKAAAG